MLVTQLRRWLDQSWQGKAQRDDMLSRLGKVVALRSHDGNNNGIGHRPRPHLGPWPRNLWRGAAHSPHAGQLGTVPFLSTNWTERKAMMPRSASASRVGPAVAVALEVFYFGESLIALEELLAYALYGCSHVCPIAVFAGPCDEALVVQTVVDRSIGHPAAHIRRQKMDDVVLAYGEVHVEIVPMCPADIRVKDELTADHETDRGWSGRRFRRPYQTPQTPGQNLDAPGLVDEVNGPPLE